jgi:hypothetical protein
VIESQIDQNLIRRYLRCANYAEELRVLAENNTDQTHRDLLLAGAESFDRAATSIEIILRSKRNGTDR